jgi:hypothetical protein
MANVCERICLTLKKIEEQKQEAEARPIRGIRTPPYHWFSYKGYKCCAMKCLRMNSRWAGFVHVPTGQELVWPSDARKRPFTVGVDFSFVHADGMVVGFHTMHLMDDVSLPGIMRHKGADYVADQLKDYVDVCTGHLRNAPAVIRSHTREKATRKKRSRV